jgi:uncharacterized membrane protein
LGAACWGNAIVWLDSARTIGTPFDGGECGILTLSDQNRENYSCQFSTLTFGRGKVETTPEGKPMSTLIIAAAIFLAIHLLISGTRVRDGITAAIGQGPYLGLFSLASLAILVWLVIAYNHAQRGSDPLLYDLGESVRHLGIPVVALAFLVGVQGLFLRSPTSVGMGGAAADISGIQGVLRITRHPFLWGVAIWSGFHLLANGDEASVIFFGTFFVLSLLGPVSIDAKRRRKLGSAWEAFANATSNVPFAAAIGGRNRLRFGELFGWRFLVALVLFLIVLFFHHRLFGVSPFPGG